MAKKGYFVLTDISGYTEFLTKSELDHAQDTLQSLFDVQLAHIQHPFVISGFRGDAIFMYVPETNFCDPQTLLESLEGLYFVFADTLRQMILNTSCPCRACQNIKNLDLKMVIHYGEYAVQKLGDHEELLGADVIVPHRMLKNHVTERTGIESYALFSEAAANALRLAELAYPLVAHSEAYEHIGEVNMQVLDLHKIWEREQDRKRFAVLPDKVWIHLQWDIPYPPVVLWEYVTNLKIELRAQGYDLVERTDSLGGRMQPESSYHCAHGATHFFTTVLDWKPFDYVSMRLETGGLVLTHTRRITPEGNGSRLTIDVERPPSGATEEARKFVIDAYNEIGRKLMSVLEADRASGAITLA
jgi:hypothetical protein